MNHELTPDWTTPKDGIIHVPNHLDPLIDKVYFQVKLHTISRRISEPEMVCRIVRAAEEFFLEPSPAPVVELEWVEDEPTIGGHRREVAKFNTMIHAEIIYYSRNTVAKIYVGLSGEPFNEEREGLNVGFDARAWCEAEILKIITPTPKP